MTRAPSLLGPFLITTAFLLAGCVGLQTPKTVPSGNLYDAQATLVVDGVNRTGDEAFRWESTTTVGTGQHPHQSLPGLAQCLLDLCPNPRAPCTPTNCERRTIHVDVPPAWAGVHESFLEFSIRWPTVFEDWFQIRLEDPAGNVLAEGQSAYLGPFAFVAQIGTRTSGDYVAVVVHAAGHSAYQGVVQLESRPRSGAARDLLPNLVTLPPTDLSFRDPPVEGVGYYGGVPGPVFGPVHAAVGSKGCATEEVLLESARRCLRFSNAVGNLGEGPLEIRLSVPDGATYLAGGHFDQRVYRSDRSTYDRAGGPAEFHPMHLHWHNAASNQYRVYHYDPATGARGALVNQGHKAGVCFADIGLVDLGLEHTGLPHYSGAPCLDPALSYDWYMGLDPNWYDNYYWPLVDQYVEMSGAPDGAYALCSVTNPDRILLESNYEDNEACTPFGLKGDEVQVVSPEPYHHTPPGAY